MTFLRLYRLLLRFVAWLTVFAMSFFSGWRDVGFDRDNYIDNYNSINYSDNLIEKLFFAKDLMFLGVVYFANMVNDNPKLAFLISCSMALFTKLAAAKVMDFKSPIIFMFLYFVFLSPGLEFAAMRSAMAIGFLMLAIANRNKYALFYFYSLLAVLSHLTVIVVVVILMPKINKYISLNKISYVVILIVGLLGSAVLIDLYPHGDAYVSNSGTLNAYILPLGTILIAKLLFVNKYKNQMYYINNASQDFLVYLNVAIFSLISLSFGLTFFIVTAATRYLEIAWVLLLISIFASRRLNVFNIMGIFLLFLWFSLINFGRNTWLAIYDPSFL